MSVEFPFSNIHRIRWLNFEINNENNTYNDDRSKFNDQSPSPLSGIHHTPLASASCTRSRRRRARTSSTSSPSASFWLDCKSIIRVQRSKINLVLICAYLCWICVGYQR